MDIKIIEWVEIPHKGFKTKVQFKTNRFANLYDAGEFWNNDWLKHKDAYKRMIEFSFKQGFDAGRGST